MVPRPKSQFLNIQRFVKYHKTTLDARNMGFNSDISGVKPSGEPATRELLGDVL